LSRNADEQFNRAAAGVREWRNTADAGSTDVDRSALAQTLKRKGRCAGWSSPRQADRKAMADYGITGKPLGMDVIELPMP
jgi:hypothetical protein